MARRPVDLTVQHEALIAALVASGRYVSADEVLRDGLRLVEQREKEYVARLEGLRRAAQDGLGDFDRGEFRAFASIEDLSTHLNCLADNAITSVQPASPEPQS